MRWRAHSTERKKKDSNLPSIFIGLSKLGKSAASPRLPSQPSDMRNTFLGTLNLSDEPFLFPSIRPHPPPILGKRKYTLPLLLPRRWIDACVCQLLSLLSSILSLSLSNRESLLSPVNHPIYHFRWFNPLEAGTCDGNRGREARRGPFSFLRRITSLIPPHQTPLFNLAIRVQTPSSYRLGWKKEIFSDYCS